MHVNRAGGLLRYFPGQIASLGSVRVLASPAAIATRGYDHHQANNKQHTIWYQHTCTSASFTPTRLTTFSPCCAVIAEIVNNFETAGVAHLQ
jgi:hypothetical protein